MKRGKAIFPIFLFFLLLSILILLFFQNPLTASLQILTVPIQRWTFMENFQPQGTLIPQQQLEQENNQLRIQLAKMEEVQKDNQALHDQFQTASPAPLKLLPANVIGMQQTTLLIDKGDQDTVHTGDVVVVKDNLIGKVTKTTPHIALITLLSDPLTSFTAQTAKTSTNGIVRTMDGGTIILANVVLSDKLEKNDLVMTKGDMDLEGHGYPPNLVVGKIVSIDKQASSLFQAAKIESLVDILQQRMVFVLTQ
jgi:cell shape-determining protein MreC